MVAKVVSGGQTGVDRAALDVALELGIDIGGWLPLGRQTEDGPLPERYVGMRECDAEAYEVRTELNVRDSDATLILACGPLSGGTALTRWIAERLRKPRLTVDLAATPLEEGVERVARWLASTQPQVLNVAGPRASHAPGVGAAAAALLRLVLGGKSLPGAGT